MSDATGNHLADILGAATSTSIAVIRPIEVDGQVNDATIVWHNDAAARIVPHLRAGITAVDVFGPTVAVWQLANAAREALKTPGQVLHLGPIDYSVEGQVRQFDVSLRAHEGLVVIEVVDRTDVYRDRQALANSEARFREMLDGLDAGVILLRPVLSAEGDIIDAEVLWANRASAGMWRRDDCLRPGTFITTSYYDVDEWIESANQAWREGFTQRMLTPNPLYTSWTAAVEVLRRVDDTLLELTIDRSHDEALLTRLDELDQRFATLIAELPLTVLVAPLSSDRLEFVSSNATELTGRPLSELRTKRDWAAVFHPDDLPSAAAVQDWAGNPDAHFEATWRLIHADGHEVLCSIRSVPRNPDAGSPGFITLITDVTEQHRLLEQIESMERLRALGRTAGSIAHDFNNLLMIVSGNIERAQRQASAEIPALVTAAAAAQRAGDLAQSLLAFARGRPGSPQTIDLADLFRRLDPILRATAPKVTLLVSVEPDLPTIVADPTHIEQILLNLVANARDATGAAGTIAVDAYRTSTAQCHLPDLGPDTTTDTWVSISVSDNGSGITRDLQASVWEPFVSNKELTKERGTGLGLSTVHGLAHQYGGHTALDSTIDKGTTVSVYLPTNAEQR